MTTYVFAFIALWLALVLIHGFYQAGKSIGIDLGVRSVPPPMIREIRYLPNDCVTLQAARVATHLYQLCTIDNVRLATEELTQELQHNLKQFIEVQIYENADGKQWIQGTITVLRPRGR